MSGGVTYQGVIPPNRFEKAALGDPRRAAREHDFFLEKIPGAGFLSRGRR